MTQRDSTAMQEICEVLLDKGLKGSDEILQLLLNHAMQIERENALNAKRYERTEERRGYANGFKDKCINSRVGKLSVQIPQVRGLSFYPQCLEKGMRSERALKLAIAEMYVQGVSTRDIEKITEQLCGLQISSSQVSKLSSVLDEEVEAWRNRELGCYCYVWLDARYEKVRHGGIVKDLAIVWAVGVNEGGNREVLGISVALSEAEIHWRDFLKSLQKRGLHGIRLFIHDDHSGLKAARRSVFPGTPWHRCQFHLAQNAQRYAPNKKIAKAIARDVRDIFNARDMEDAKRLLTEVVQKYEKKAPSFSKWAQDNIPEGFTAFHFPREHYRRLRTTNGIERQNQEIKRRTRVVRIFPNERSALRLIGAVLLEIHEDWMTGRQYLNMEALKEMEQQGEFLQIA